MSIRVLLVDDSPLMRTILRDMLKSEEGIEVVGVACDGMEGVRMANQLKPDVITMDVEMPKKDGLSALREIMRTCPTPVIMVSTLTSKGTSATIEALSSGAVDFVCKPNNGAIREFRSIHDELVAKIRGAAGAKVQSATVAPIRSSLPRHGSDNVIVIASSTGGPRSLASLWEQWPSGLQCPILIVQHMPAGFTASLANRLNNLGTVPCFEAKPGDVVTKGVAYLAPGGKHMRVGPNGALIFDEEPTIHGVRPAADHLFQTAVQRYGSKCVGIVLTGMGKDGAAGAKAIKDAGGVVFGESEQTCTVYGMPRAAAELDAVYAECPIYELGHVVMATMSRRNQHAS